MIPIQNVYYMLSYTFKVLNVRDYKRVETEPFHNAADLCAALLVKGVSLQVKRGLGKAYLSEKNTLSSPRGKFELTESIKELSVLKNQLVCTYDEFSVNSYMNQIVKTTMILLLKADVASCRKKELRRLLEYFVNVDTLDIYGINWRFQFNRNNQAYRMLVSICYLVIKNLLQTQTDGSTKLMDFFDERQMHKIYERFILEYYRAEHPKIIANASRIPWDLDDDFDEYLPSMQTDITLKYEERTLIIDAKYYEESLIMHYNQLKEHSGNMYQIFTYVKNMEGALTNTPHEKVIGMLLYAQTDTIGGFDKEYRMSGNRICVRTLDLNCDFQNIRMQLDSIVNKYLVS